MLPKLTRPKILRKKSGSRSDSGSEGEGNGQSAPIPNVKSYLDDQLPNEYFRQDVLRLVRDLRIHGWNLVTMEMSQDLVLKRISGALTNSVYALKPPPYIKEALKKEYNSQGYRHRVPINLLLRIYGPSVDLLIDREKELATVAHLSAHNVGPRLLGTFVNGRFEQFLDAQPLAPADLRNKEISVLIAKRMRDLHDNVPLKAAQRAEGPLVWQGIEQWEQACLTQLNKLETSDPGSAQKALKTDPVTFFNAIKKYRAFLEDRYGNQKINDELVFAHNDTQHGNILRVDPPKGSPLLRPANEHRQLVVIDFEYSGPNPRAYDIANHFCEWMNDYLHPTLSHHVWTERYPTEEEQMNFINSYIEHGASTFDDAVLEAEAKALLDQSRHWRPIVSAYWTVWAIIQARVDEIQEIEMREELLQATSSAYTFNAGSPVRPYEIVTEVSAEQEFDYLGYATEKASIFWSDLKELAPSI